MNSRPWRTMFIERVMTIGGTRRMAMPTPLTTPTSTPPSRMRGMIQISGPSWPRASAVSRTAAQLSVHGTDRSMPPPMMTIVWPIATMPVNDGDDEQRRDVVRVGEPGREEADQARTGRARPMYDEQDRPRRAQPRTSVPLMPPRAPCRRARSAATARSGASSTTPTRIRPDATCCQYDDRPTQEDDVGDLVEDEGADHRPDDATAAARQARAADHDGGDRGQDELGPDDRRPGPGLGREEQAGERREEPGQARRPRRSCG